PRRRLVAQVLRVLFWSPWTAPRPETQCEQNDRIRFSDPSLRHDLPHERRFASAGRPLLVASANERKPCHCYRQRKYDLSRVSRGRRTPQHRLPIWLRPAKRRKSLASYLLSHVDRRGPVSR